MNQKSTSVPTLTLCMIVKNERDSLPRCLASVKPYVDEMIIVDTGSDDGTPEMATNYGAKVRYFEWCDDFAAARNYAISQASGDWILMMDADEELIVNSEHFLDEITDNPEIIACTLTYTEIDDYRERIPYYRISLFRNLPGLRYVSRFHEYLTYQNQPIKSNQGSHTDSLKILHYGHSKELVRQKSLSRDIPILEDMRQQEVLSFMLLFTLADLYVKNQKQEKAQECFAEAFERLRPNLINGNPPEDFRSVPSLIYALGMQFFEKKDYETACLLCKRGIKWCPDYPPLNYLAGVILCALEFPLGATAYFKKCIQIGQGKNYYKCEPFDLIFITTHPAYNLGLMYLKLARLQEALDAFELALFFDANFTLAQKKIDYIKQLLATNI